jgi:hypothetical protein
MTIATVHPYRVAERPRAMRVRFWPGVSLVKIAALVALAMPLAWVARSEGRAASTVTCSTVSQNDWAAPCQVHDAHTVAAPERIACSDAPAALDALMDVRNPLSRPFVTAVISESPAPPDTVVVPAKGVMVNGAPMAVVKRVRHDDWKSTPPAAPLPRPVADASGGISMNDARTLMAACTARSGTSGPTQTVAFAIVERDYTSSVAVLAAGILFALVFALRRRVGVTVDGSGGVTVLERGWFLARRRESFAAADVADVRVVSGASGPFAASRVEIVKRDGETIPLTHGFVALSSAKCARAAARLQLLLGVSSGAA